MITQAIKRWLHSLFAWWPWKQPSEADYAEALGILNTSATPEAMLQTNVDGPMTQPGFTTVAIEHIAEEPGTEPSRASTEERSDCSSHVVQSTSSVTDENDSPGDLSHPSSEGITQSSTTLAREVSAPTPQQRLEFLRYLVQRGLVNEDFGKGQKRQAPEE